MLLGTTLPTQPLALNILCTPSGQALSLLPAVGLVLIPTMLGPVQIHETHLYFLAVVLSKPLQGHAQEKKDGHSSLSSQIGK